MSQASVLMTADAVGGVWTYALDMARELSAAGVATRLAVMGPAPSEDQRREAGATPGLSLIETGLPLDWMASSPAEIQAAGDQLRRLARELNVDLVHLNSPAHAAGGAWDAPVVGACHSCLATWWAAVREGPMPEDFRWRTQALWKGLTACQALIAPSRAFAEEVARTYDVPRPFAVHNGRAAPVSVAAPRERCVVTTGRLWDDGKNLATLDAAAAKLDALLYAAGPQNGPSGEWRELRHAKPLGRLSAEAVRQRLPRSAIFASAALYEPFGLSVLEAAQARCALVLSDIPTFRELWDGAAVFVDAQDPDAWAAALQALLDDPARARALGVAAWNRAADYGAAAMAAGALDVYRLLSPAIVKAALHEAAA